MRKITTLLLAVLAINLSAHDKFWLGADISGTTAIEAFGGQLYNAAGEPRECTALMKELGLNAVRLRVWVNPKGGFSSKDDVLKMALRAQALDMPVMIDFHYSDWWADPGKQNIPAAWADLDYNGMKQALAQHTIETLQLLKDSNIDVRWVQVGNETTNGFLWPMGRAQENMEQYAGLTQAGYDAVKQVYPNATVIIHLDCACDPARYDFIFDGLRQYGTRFDMIGVSVYPYWDIDAGLETDYKGTVKDFAANIKRISEKYGVETMIVETGVEAKKPVEGKEILQAIFDAAINDCGGHCHGIFYWAPEAEGGYPLGAFDNHRPTIIMDVFTQAARTQK
ncbi:MAG: glycosyl hydrolase 53 family protein [Muribaculaceae bacterium]|nr:glycosyl hydrolase 53 family protein [Muribaculaceae bacterium]